MVCANRPNPALPVRIRSFVYAFRMGDLIISGRRTLSATFTVRNIGERAGAQVAQLYLVTRKGEPQERLVGFQKVALAPGESRSVSFTIDSRLLADWRSDAWWVPDVLYTFALGDSADLGAAVRVKVMARRLAP